jgi:hypothetical protein
MHTELANIVIHMKIDLIFKAYDFNNATFYLLHPHITIEMHHNNYSTPFCY